MRRCIVTLLGVVVLAVVGILATVGRVKAQDGQNVGTSFYVLSIPVGVEISTTAGE